MDERIRKSRGTRKLLFCAAALVVPAISMADEPNSSSFMRARLVSGFGAGTDRGVTGYAANRTSRARSTTEVVETAKSQELSMRAAPPQVARSSSKTPFVIRAAKQVPPEPRPRLPQPVTDLAALIRTVNAQPNSAGNSSNRFRAADLRVPFGRRSIQVEMAPAVRRISLGTYDPNRPGGFDSQAIVRLAEPVDAKSLHEAKPKQVKIPNGDTKLAPPADIRLHSLPESVEDSLDMNEAESKANEIQKNSSTPALIQALADPGVSELIETFPETKADAKIEVDSTPDEMIQWEMLLSE